MSVAPAEVEAQRLQLRQLVNSAVWSCGRDPLITERDRNILIGQLVTDLLTPQASTTKPQTFITQKEYQEQLQRKLKWQTSK